MNNTFELIKYIDTLGRCARNERKELAYISNFSDTMKKKKERTSVFDTRSFFKILSKTRFTDRRSNN